MMVFFQEGRRGLVGFLLRSVSWVHSTSTFASMATRLIFLEVPGLLFLRGSPKLVLDPLFMLEVEILAIYLPSVRKGLLLDLPLYMYDLLLSVFLLLFERQVMLV